MARLSETVEIFEVYREKEQKFMNDYYQEGSLTGSLAFGLTVLVMIFLPLHDPMTPEQFAKEMKDIKER